MFREQLAIANIPEVSELTPSLDHELQRFIRKSFEKRNSSHFCESVLEFCVAQAVTTQDIAATVERFPCEVPDAYFKIAEMLTSNLSLNCMILAHRVLW